ncbi:hypothetical protein CC80DRAFT_185147 [Byssothecium circinans]|uniref:Uncharacterized protein n=1 Tax=Byssothecium circinans TaxID=147558 RepID=A0A6A5TSV1_9PLEO|nr:hypothetical protein CC80DRAFT_185147 [Byssothecium circinans]
MRGSTTSGQRIREGLQRVRRHELSVGPLEKHVRKRKDYLIDWWTHSASCMLFDNDFVHMLRITGVEEDKRRLSVLSALQGILAELGRKPWRMQLFQRPLPDAQRPTSSVQLPTNMHDHTATWHSCVYENRYSHPASAFSYSSRIGTPFPYSRSRNLRTPPHLRRMRWACIPSVSE